MKKPYLTVKYPARVLQVNGFKKTKSQVKRTIYKKVKQLANHFDDVDNGGWPIYFQYNVNDILKDLLGFNLEEEFIQALNNNNMAVEFHDGNVVLITRGNYEPIFMNPKSGGLRILNNPIPGDKTRLELIRNGWVMVGVL